MHKSVEAELLGTKSDIIFLTMNSNFDCVKYDTKRIEDFELALSQYWLWYSEWKFHWNQAKWDTKWEYFNLCIQIYSKCSNKRSPFSSIKVIKFSFQFVSLIV